MMCTKYSVRGGASEDKAAAVSEFLLAFDDAQALLAMVEEARVVGHPEYQVCVFVPFYYLLCPLEVMSPHALPRPNVLAQAREIDLTPVNHKDADVQKMVVSREVEVWLGRKKTCSEQQPRILLLSPAQLLDMLRAMDTAIDTERALPRFECSADAACGGIDDFASSAQQLMWR